MMILMNLKKKKRTHSLQNDKSEEDKQFEETQMKMK